MDEDEFDAYDIEFDVEHLPYLTDLPPSPITSPTRAPAQVEIEVAIPQNLRSATSPVSEFADYDLSEFTAEDLDAFDPPPVKRDVNTTIVDSIHESKAPSISGEGASHQESVHHASDPFNSRTLPRQVSGGPAINIELEQSTDAGKEGANMDSSSEPLDDSKGKGKRPTCLTPSLSTRPSATSPNLYAMFRSRTAVFGVTDLVGPTWCEYQFEYGLRQRRHRKTEDRLASFKTAQGKIITVDKTVAVDNEKRMERGKTIHKALELEVHPEEVPVEIATPEEKWALRLVKLIDCVQSLLTVGRCREMPVFGIVHDEMVVGIIDEVSRAVVLPKPHASARPSQSERKRIRPDSSVQNTPTKQRPMKMPKNETLAPTQTLLTTFLVSSSTSTSLSSQRELDSTIREGKSPDRRPCTPPHDELPESIPSFCLHVLDTKTRFRPTMPQIEDTLSTRLQLMLYRRLLSGIIAPPASSEALDFERFFTRLQLSRTREFSGKFQRDTQLPVDLNCLEKLETCWRTSLEMLNVIGVDDFMTVEYRLQQRRSLKRHRRKELSASDQEREDIAKAVAASLVDQTTNTEASTTQTATAASGSFDSAAKFSSADEPCVLAGTSPKVAVELDVNASDLPVPATENKVNTSTSDSRANKHLNEGDSSSESEPEIASSSGIIGTRKIRHDDAFLDAHLTDILQFWHGQRAPRGVDVTLTRRCRTCEYVEGCEWREQKAEEIVAKLHDKKGEVDV